MTPKQVIIIIFVLLFTTAYCRNYPCHSSCADCDTSNPKKCSGCDGELVINSNFQCVASPGVNLIFQIIDHTWVSNSLVPQIEHSGTGGSTNNASQLNWNATSPLILNYWDGLPYISIHMANIPPNHYKLQFRAAGYTDYMNGCMSSQVDVSWDGSTYTPFFVASFYHTEITETDKFHTDTYLQLQYFFIVGSLMCQFYAFTDFTIVVFLCDPVCKTCSGFPNNCQSCDTFMGAPQYLLLSFNGNYTCSTFCPLSYFTNSTHNYCNLCDLSCKKCSQSITNCTECDKDNGYVATFLNSSKCVFFCPPGQYKDMDAVRCLPCDVSCLTCVTTNKTCLSCGTSLGGQLYLNNFACVFNCPKGTYTNTTANQCRKCDVACLTCTGPTNADCLLCGNNTVLGTLYIYYLSIGGSVCNLTCPSGQFISPNIPNYCQQCSSLCVTCSGTAGTCLSCPSGFYWHMGTCLSTCVAGTYPNSTQCIGCHPACVACFGGGTSACYSCRKDPNTNIAYYLILGTTICNETCPLGQVKGSNFQCVACAQPCSVCSITTTNCTHCSTVNGVTVVYLQNSTCVTVCAVGTYPQTGTSNNLCLNCDSSCASCFGPLQTSCTQCKNVTNITYFKDPFTPTCNTTCPQGYFGSITTNLCTQCQTGCSSCQTNASYCQSCANVGSIAYYLIGNSCVNLCPNGFYANGNVCSQCHIYCAACTGSLNTDCSSCGNATVNGVFTQFYLAIRTTTCNSGCPPGQYISGSFPNSCQQCSSLCVSCEGNPNNCTNGQCPFGYFFFNNSCISNCFPGFYGDKVTWHCLSCDPACSTCFAGGTVSCYSCKFDTATNTTFYLQLGTNICAAFCPFGQIPSTNNLCAACAPQCAGCSMLQTNCTNCSSLNGVFVYLQNGTCSAVCQSGTYPQNGSSNNNLCLPCNSACSACFGPLISNCHSCRNITSSAVTTIYYKDPTMAVCSTNCPVGYVGINSSNVCTQCQTGCVSCQNTTVLCQSCRMVGNIYYYFYQNSCLMICPDGTYKNDTDLSCNVCIFFTLNQQCIRQCPSGYIGVKKPNNASVCQGCNSDNCPTFDIPFAIQTTVIPSSKNFKHQVKLPSGLHPNCTAQYVSVGLQVYLYMNKIRLLTTAVPLNVLSVSVDQSTIIVITDSQPVEISSATIDIQFRAGALITPQGILYTSTSSSISLQNPVFISSYYQAYGKNMNDQIQGIVLIIGSSLFLVIALILGNQQTINQMIVFVQSIQMVGLMRVRVLPIVLSVHNVLVGFSYYEMQFVPNPFIYFIPGFSPNEITSDSAKMVYGYQNLINNFASLLCLMFFLLLITFLFYLPYSLNEGKMNIIKLIVKTIIEYFLFIIVYGCLLALSSLNSNTLTDSNVLFISSITFSLAIIIGCLVYFVKNYQEIKEKQFYKITYFLKIVCLIILGSRFDIAAICFNSFELVTILIEVSRCQKASKHPYLRFIQRVVILVCINFCLFIKQSNNLIYGLAVIFGIIGCMKVYYLLQSILSSFQKDDSQNIIDPKSTALKLQENYNSASQGFIFQEIISENKEESMQKSLGSINQMRETALTNNYPRHDTTLNEYHIRQIFGDGNQIGARRKRGVKRLQIIREQNKNDHNIQPFEHIEIINIEPRSELSIKDESGSEAQEKQSRKEDIMFEPEFASGSEDSDYVQIISIQ